MSYTAQRARRAADAYNAGATARHRWDGFRARIRVRLRAIRDNMKVSSHVRSIRHQARKAARRGQYGCSYDAGTLLPKNVATRIKEQLEGCDGYAVKIGLSDAHYAYRLTTSFDITW